MATATANTAAASVCSSRALHGGERSRRPPLSSSRQSFDVLVEAPFTVPIATRLTTTSEPLPMA
ncbi:Hypothetical protein FKW44_004927, partial [Caligus rogercresseyi]